MSDLTKYAQGKRMVQEDLIKKIGENAAEIKKKVTSYKVDNITAITGDILSKLKAGDIVLKKTGEQYHSYVVSFKKDDEGICLTYTDASVVETVSYDLVGTTWTYNSTDTTQLGGGGAAKKYKHIISFNTTLTLDIGEAGQQTKAVSITLAFINNNENQYTVSTLKSYDSYLLHNCSGTCVFNISGVANMRLIITFYSVSTNYTMFVHAYNATDGKFYDYFLSIPQSDITLFTDTVTEE